MASLEERNAAKQQMEAAEAELRTYTDRPLGAPMDIALHTGLAHRLQQAMAAILEYPEIKTPWRGLRC